MRHEHVTPLARLPEHLRSLRKAHKLTLKEVADRADISLSFLSDVERGRAYPSLITLTKMAACYRAELVISIDGAKEVE